MPLFARDPSSKPATDNQVDYIIRLLDKTNLDYGWVGDQIGRKINRLLEMTVSEAGSVIELLKEEMDDARWDDYEPEPWGDD